MSKEQLQIEAIGLIQSPFVTKFGIPRQAGLLPDIHYKLKFSAPYCREEYWQGLFIGQYIWVLFYFHESKKKSSPTVRPPRLGGTKRLGVFATRSPHRPNPIGLSLVKICQIDIVRGKLDLIVSGGDFLDQTPILDIRPYIPENEKIDATMPFAVNEQKIKISASPDILDELPSKSLDFQKFFANIIKILELNPLPQSNSQQKRKKDLYKMKLTGPQNVVFDIHFKVQESEFLICKIIPDTKITPLGFPLV